jgi:hypothetical protein
MYFYNLKLTRPKIKKKKFCLNFNEFIPYFCRSVCRVIIRLLEADFKLTCDGCTCHGNGTREKDDAYW